MRSPRARAAAGCRSSGGEIGVGREVRHGRSLSVHPLRRQAAQEAPMRRCSTPMSRHASPWHVNIRIWWRVAASNSARFMKSRRASSVWTRSSSSTSKVGRPASRSRSISPLRLWPKRKSSPTSSHLACSPCTSRFSMKALADISASRALKRSTTTWDTP
ncbi:hypothetical protein G6F50_015736 [Rhizopus delemar]|uniref:Uncharacterized protein n=1 Tax=Rhizopus delemar TaxID=936053 RepID=A0A9P6XW45_9FUNG|nr:hypothetical protein G6F50_015736 [Rhizopus delemar]